MKHTFWLANNTVFVVAQYTNLQTGEHQYIQWLREKICWYKDEPAVGAEAPLPLPSFGNGGTG